MSRIIVVGGGIAGLAAARELALSGEPNVSVLEATSRWGGKIAAVTLDGVRLDSGAESMLARRPEAVNLVADLGLTDRLVHPTSAKSQLLVGGRARPLPPSAMGIPRGLDELEGYLSPAGLTRARKEPDLPAPGIAGDIGIGLYVDERFGPEVTDRLLEPLLGGVYAGRSRDLSFDAVSPELFRRARQGGSLLQHARELGVTTASGPVFAGLEGGISTLVDALVADLTRRGVTLRPSVTVRELIRRPVGGYRLLCGPVSRPERVEADGVVLAAPAGPTGRLLAPLSPVGVELAAVPYASMAVVTLVVKADGVTGSGLLVPPGELATIKALTYSSEKWSWVSRQASQAWGDYTSVVRASVGRLGEAHLLQVDDDELMQRTYDELTTVPGWDTARLVTGQVQRWGGGLPQYLVGHRDLVLRVWKAVSTMPGLAVCGAAYDGLGIAACLASGAAAAGKVSRDLASAGIGGHGAVVHDRMGKDL